MAEQATLNRSFWDTDWGKVIKIVFSGFMIALTGGLVYAFMKRNKQFAPARMVNREIAQSLIDKTKVTLNRFPEKAISISATVSDREAPMASMSGVSLSTVAGGEMAMMSTSTAVE